ncbi:VOC family protein [Mycobacterium palustre]|uniref:VOC domain-containing protein n=1 Tax=Mycobacterium palustre TaxID=153971 RepID=A0A1X1ZX16_9MYCO|nr:VOC family protein [Mycobacterium palustre]ORW28918.1 hypothetical protein AWC19_26345 [Mycobacterium palustre]
MTQQQSIAAQNFSRVRGGVSDVELGGAGLDAVTGGSAQRGRRADRWCDGRAALAGRRARAPECRSGPQPGYTNIPFQVDDLDAAYDAVRRQHPDVRAEPPVDLGGARTFFIHDPCPTA